jgi:hypothetical protein
MAQVAVALACAAVLGLPALFVGVLLFRLVQRFSYRFFVLGGALLLGLVALALDLGAVFADVRGIFRDGAPLFGDGSVMSSVGSLWVKLIFVAPLAALLLALFDRTAPFKPFVASPDLTDEPEIDALTDQQLQQAPDAVQGVATLGAALRGKLDGWRVGPWVVYPSALLQRHAILVGGPANEPSEALLRIAFLAARVYGWKVFFLDAVGGQRTAERFLGVMDIAGRNVTAAFPLQAYSGWRGDDEAILQRLLAIYDGAPGADQALVERVLRLACFAPGGAPRTSGDLLDRLHLDGLLDLYEDDPRIGEVQRLTADEMHRVLVRYARFFDPLDQKLDGAWSLDTVDIGYISIDTLGQREHTGALGRYLLADLAHYVERRKPADERVLLIVNGLQEVQRPADTARLMERIGAFGASVIVAAEQTAQFEPDVEPLFRAVATTILLSGAGAERLIGPNGLRAWRQVKLDPAAISRLAVDECCILSNGGYQIVRLAPIHAAKRDMSQQYGLGIYTPEAHALDASSVSGGRFRRKRELAPYTGPIGPATSMSERSTTNMWNGMMRFRRQRRPPAQYPPERNNGYGAPTAEDAAAAS